MYKLHAKGLIHKEKFYNLYLIRFKKLFYEKTLTKGVMESGSTFSNHLSYENIHILCTESNLKTQR